MTSPISGVGGTVPVSGTQQNTSSALDNLNSNDFLQLLVTQLTNQDPDSPTDPTEFMAQTAQLAEVDKLDSMAQQQSQLLSSQLSAQAAQLVGKTVDYRSASGQQSQGLVTGTTFGTSPTLKIGGADVPLSSVTGIGTAA